MKTRKNKFVAACLILSFSSMIASAQTSGNFTITQSVIAGGGGQSAAGGNFSLDGTVGQATAGGVLAGSTFSLTSGFWNFAPLVPTAASTTVSGRVITAGGRGLVRAIVTVSDSSGEMRSVLTGSFGYYRFENVPVGNTYIFEVKCKKYLFAPQVVTVSEDITDLNFRAAQ